jgi:hypothetical protein
LTDHKCLPSDVADAEIHFTLGVIEDSEAGYFTREIINVALRVAVFDPEENQHAMLDLADELTFDLNTRLSNPLNERSQV